MHDLGRHRRTLDHFGRRAPFAWTRRFRASRRAGRPDVPADQRQPCRLRQAGQSQRARHPRGSDQQDQRDAGKAVVHDSHRRYHASVEGGRVRRRRTHHLAGQARCALCAGRTRFPRRRGQVLPRALRAGAKGAGWYSFDASGVHFIGLVNVVDLKAGGLGNLGAEQLEWLEADLKGRSKSTPIVVFAHIPLWTVYPQWGWGTEDGARALDYLKGFGSVTVLNGHIHQVMQKVEGNVTFHTARSTAFPQPAPGTAPSPGPMKVEDARLRTLLGVASINFKPGDARLAIIDTPLQG